MQVDSPKDLFETKMPTRLQENPDLAAKINSSYKFIVNGDAGGTWLVDLTCAPGQITTGDGDAACTVTIADKDLVKIVNGDLNAQMAFMSGKLKVAGDMGLAMKLSALFA